jgi:Flp pilus assembly pilin Flp
MRERKIARLALALYRDERGSEMLEYALVTAVLSMTLAFAFILLTTSANDAVTASESNVSTFGISPP